MQTTEGTFPLGEFLLESGKTLHHATLGYHTWGTLNKRRDNAIVLPSYYSGTTKSYEPWVIPGAHRLFDPDRFFIISYDQFGAGASSKPASPRASLDAWTHVALNDSVRAAKLLLDHWEIKDIKLVMGWSMGGMQAFAWARMYPSMVRNVFALCATPYCNPVNQVFLKGIEGILTQGNDGFLGGLAAGDLKARLREFGRVYAGWAYSDEFFLNGDYADIGYASIDALLEEWASDHSEMNPEELLAQLYVWKNTLEDSVIETETTSDSTSDRIPHVIAMPCNTDRYFLVEALKRQVTPSINLDIIELSSSLGHCAGRPGIRSAETKQIRTALQRFGVAFS